MRDLKPMAYRRMHLGCAVSIGMQLVLLKLGRVQVQL